MEQQTSQGNQPQVEIPFHNGSGFNYTQSLLETPISDELGSHDNDNDISNWRGGDHLFEGSHDPFCFMCGIREDTVTPCQTCSRSYHSQCMFPPLYPEQVPDVWFCPVCVARNWHIPPLSAIQTPPTTLPSTSVSSTPVPSTDPNGDATRQQDALSPTVGTSADHRTHASESITVDDGHDGIGSQDARWHRAQRWKENSQYAPRGYMLDPTCVDRFIPTSGEGPSISLSTVLEARSTESLNNAVSGNEGAKGDSGQQTIATNSSIPPTTQTKPYRAGKLVTKRNRSPPRKRSKYSNLPSEIEKAFDLIKNHLESVSNDRRSQDTAENEVKILEQKLRMKEGEMLICNQELQAVKGKLAAEQTNIENLKTENDILRTEIQELKEVAQKKDNQMKNWQNMLRTMVGTDGEMSMG
ncbi:hypothetical protein F5884DRAFT_554644 [Xylogone sp. PMI_703]|nr:hypothetical protein F5884DRAFT_554644 [Xylogone sp. PMI_703]